MTRKPSIVETEPQSARRTRFARVGMGRRAALLGAGAAAALLVAGCSPSTTQQTAPNVTVTPTVSASKTAPPTPAVPAVWPLTGVAAADVVERPALAVKIENPREARPQTGLEAADMVWEEMVEGGVPRFVAVYHSVIPKEVGPVRSVRPMDPAITAPLKGLLAFSGGQAPFISAVRAAGVQVLSQDTGNSGFFRTGSRGAPHNLHATPSTLLNQADAGHRAAPAPQFAFARTAAKATVAASGTAARNVNVTISTYSHPAWSWSVADKAWLRSEGTVPSVSVAGTRLSAQNVVVLRVKIVMTKYVDPGGAHVPETVLVGSGAGLVATGGKVMQITWSKASAAAPVVLKAAGAEVLLAPGKTWIELVPTGSGAVATS